MSVCGRPCASRTSQPSAGFIEPSVYLLTLNWYCRYSSLRENMTLFLSQDNGVSWHPHLRVDPGPSAYSSLLAVNDTAVALAYEAGGYASIRFGVLSTETD